MRFSDVASQIDGTSVQFKSITDPDATVLEQNYEYDLVSADKLLEKYIDKQIEVLTKDGSHYQGTLQSFDGNQLVIRQRGREGRGNRDGATRRQCEGHSIWRIAGRADYQADTGVETGDREGGRANDRGRVSNRGDQLAGRLQCRAQCKRHRAGPRRLGDDQQPIRRDVQGREVEVDRRRCTAGGATAYECAESGHDEIRCDRGRWLRRESIFRVSPVHVGEARDGGAEPDQADRVA